MEILAMVLTMLVGIEHLGIMGLENVCQSR